MLSLDLWYAPGCACDFFFVVVVDDEGGFVRRFSNLLFITSGVFLEIQGLLHVSMLALRRRKLCGWILVGVGIVKLQSQQERIIARFVAVVFLQWIIIVLGWLIVWGFTTTVISFSL